MTGQAAQWNHLARHLMMASFPPNLKVKVLGACPSIRNPLDHIRSLAIKLERKTKAECFEQDLIDYHVWRINLSGKYPHAVLLMPYGCCH
jgi:hypothetical protein